MHVAWHHLQWNRRRYIDQLGWIELPGNDQLVRLSHQRHIYFTRFELVCSVDLRRLPDGLTSLDLGYNQFSGSVDLRYLPASLTSLRLVYNQFSGIVFGEALMTSSGNDHGLSIWSNPFTCPLPAMPSWLSYPGFRTGMRLLFLSPSQVFSISHLRSPPCFSPFLKFESTTLAKSKGEKKSRLHCSRFPPFVSPSASFFYGISFRFLFTMISVAPVAATWTADVFWHRLPAFFSVAQPSKKCTRKAILFVSKKVWQSSI